MKKAFIISFVLVSVLLAHVAFAAEFGERPNYASTEHAGGLSFNHYGYVQVQPSTVQSGMHCYNGYIRYTNGIPDDSGRLYTASGTGCSDSRILSKSYTYTDNPFNSDPVEFSYGFGRTAHGAIEMWP